VRVLVIGGNGFVGSHVVDELLLHDHQVIIFDRSPDRFRQALPMVEHVRGELGNRGELERTIAAGVDVVVHLVSSTLPKNSNDDPIFDVQMNLVESIALMELCVKHKVKKLVFISSGGTVYGIPRHLPIREDHPTYPICSYGIVKLAIEKYLLLYHHLHGLPYCVLRLANPYGVRQDPRGTQGVVSVFLGKMMKEEEIQIWGDGATVRDFVNVKDIARLCRLAFESPAIGIFNAGSGAGVSVERLVDLIAEQFNLRPRVVRKAARDFDAPAIILDPHKAKHEFGWAPLISMHDGLEELYEWLETDVFEHEKKTHFSFKL
jgi:UDP-glucose 4-epimerase